MEIVKDEIAFEGDKEGYHLKATYLKDPEGESLVEISKDRENIKEFLFPSYKIWNIAAHFHDIIQGLEKNNEGGLLIAGSDGLGGNVF